MDTDVAIIGSGPAGVTAAKVFLEAGLKVIIIEAGDSSPIAGINNSWSEFRESATGQAGELFSGFFDLNNSRVDRSPKFSTPWLSKKVDDAASILDLEFQDFAGTQIPAIGGLSESWGAGVGIFDNQDLSDWPINFEDLKSHYTHLATTMGLSGPWPNCCGEVPKGVGEHPGLHPTAKKLLGNYQKNAQKFKFDDFKLGPALQAVATTSELGRHPCELLGNCLYGCTRKSIWSASLEIEQLKQESRFTLLAGVLVEAVSRSEQGTWKLLTPSKDGRQKTIHSRHLVCAAGAIGSTRIISSALQTNNMEFNLQSTPIGGFALFLPRRLGAKWEKAVFGLSQLNFSINLNTPGEYVFGNTFAAENMPRTFLEKNSPFSHRGTMDVFKELTPAVLLANIFFDGKHSKHTIRVYDGKVCISGGQKTSLENTVIETEQKIRKYFRKLGAFVVPSKIKLGAPGSDLHFASTIPMKTRPSLGECDVEGNVYGLENLIIVDASTFPTLPPKSHTLTVMANARRIANIWAKRWRSD